MNPEESKPTLLDEAAAKAFLKKTGDNVFFVDALPRQLKELFLIDHHQFIGQPKNEVYASAEYAAYAEARKNDFIHVYFPWNLNLIKTVSAENYFRLKTNRNQDLITAEEQKILRGYKVAVLGMSVGSNIAFVLTQAGISEEIIVADFDELDTTNLNRILAGAHQIGINKTTIAARRIYEDNPFAKVTAWSRGVNEENLETVLKDGQINCLIEEIDDIGMKIVIRRLALKYKVPVLMITDNGDGVVFHAERYDLGYDKIFGQDLVYWEEKMRGEMTRDKAGGIIIGDIVGGPEQVDPKMLASVKRVLNKELVSWSQLGSAAILGGVLATVALKEIILGRDRRLAVRARFNPLNCLRDSDA